MSVEAVNGNSWIDSVWDATHKTCAVVKKVIIVAAIVLAGIGLFCLNPGFFLTGIGLGIFCRAQILKEGKQVKEAISEMPILAKAGLVTAVALGGFLALATTLAFASLLFAAGTTAFAIQRYSKIPSENLISM